MIPEAIQDLGFQFVPPHRQQIVTGALVAGGGATVMGLADFGEAIAAGSASEKTREKVTRSASAFGADAFVLGRDARPRSPAGVP